MENYHFSASRRLKKPAQFNTVYSNNQTRVKGQYFTVLAFCRFKSLDKSLAGDTMARAENAPARVGVVVSKKVSKLAVQRNRLKRQVRERFRTRAHPAGFDFVVIARPGAATVSNTALANELEELWKRLHRRCAALLSP